MNENLSRLMDGELPDSDVERVLGECRGKEALACWACYHLIGDALRGSHDLSGAMPRGFAQAFAVEPTVLAPRRRLTAGIGTRAWAVAAGVAAAGVVAWTAVSLTQTPGTAVAKAREATTVTAAQLRPQTLPQDYVLVHQEYSPATAIQGVRPYVRAVSAPAVDRP
ncbi:MAG TPA: sigma-E factor negative regulatory protein [Casimicrobiaceae bacterium]|nr:sigma-E factor negative regulatory protein [Casimicrobiaceae bacterium]